MTLKDLNDKLLTELDAKDKKKKEATNIAGDEKETAGDKILAPGVLKVGGKLYPPTKLAYSTLVNKKSE
jgi:hypothetical protein